MPTLLEKIPRRSVKEHIPHVTSPREKVSRNTFVTQRTANLWISFLNRMDISCILFCYYSSQWLQYKFSLPPCNETCFLKTSLQIVNKVHWWESQTSKDLDFLSFGKTSSSLQKVKSSYWSKGRIGSVYFLNIT